MISIQQKTKHEYTSAPPYLKHQHMFLLCNSLPHRTAPTGAVLVPALPASDLERLDGAEIHDQPVASTPSASPGQPTTGVLLLGGLALLSLIGVRRRQPLREPT